MTKQTIELECPAGFEYTGEHRLPSPGEWFLGRDYQATVSECGLINPRLILRPVVTEHDRLTEKLGDLFRRAHAGEITIKTLGVSECYGNHMRSFNYTEKGIPDGSERP